MGIFERYLLLEGGIFDFHDGRKCTLPMFNMVPSKVTCPKIPKDRFSTNHFQGRAVTVNFGGEKRLEAPGKGNTLTQTTNLCFFLEVQNLNFQAILKQYFGAGRFSSFT